MLYRCLSLLFGLLLLCFGLSGVVSAQTRYFTIGTGDVGGVYYPTGAAIARMINMTRSKYDIRVTVEATAGSVYNVNALMNSSLELGIVQSDRQYQAVHGLADWAGRPQSRLRALFAIHPESVTIVAAADKNIRTLNDLRGKLVSIGNVGSGQRRNALDLFAAAGIDYQTDLHTVGLETTEAARQFQAGQVDAFFYTVGHPNGVVEEAVSGIRKARIIEVPAEVIKALTVKYPYYAASEIPVDHYADLLNEKNVKSFGVKATFCTSSELPADVAYALTREVFDNLSDFKKLHPAYVTLTKEGMLEGLSAPLHPGALRYFEEVGLR